MVFGVWFSKVRGEAPLSNSVSLPPQQSGARLALELFRRERDISQFD